MKIRLKIIKADRTSEQYLHTKVIHAINKALADIDEPDMQTAENLAEVITYYLYNKHGDTKIQSCEIMSVIKVTLTATGFEDAAEALTLHSFQRKLKRTRVELVHGSIEDISDADTMAGNDGELRRSRWNKSEIVNDLVSDYHLNRRTARVIAAMVEERVFNLQLTHVPGGLVKQLMLNDAAAVLRAQKQLQSA